MLSLIVVFASNLLGKGCSNPGVPRNGLKHGLSYFYDDVVKFSCDACYSIVGHSQRKCLKNGTWSDSQPKCVCE